MMNEELRCYTFTNFMLSSIQQGIQAGHAAVELFNKYTIDQGWINGMAEQVNDWASNYKTLVCLNGGNADSIKNIKGFFDMGKQQNAHTFPYVGFFEDEQSLDGALTSVAVILPARIFETASLMRRRELPVGVSYTHDKILGEHRFIFDSPIPVAGEPPHIQSIETFSQWEYDLMILLNQHGLAR